MEGWNKSAQFITTAIDLLAAKYGVQAIDNSFSFSTRVGDTSIIASFCFRRNPSNKKIWAVQSINKMINEGGYQCEIGGNTYLDHLDETASQAAIAQMFMEWTDAIRDTVNQYKDDCSFYEYKAGV